MEKPQASQLAEIERLQGQLDAIVTTVADLAGVPETDFRAAPNNVDLKVFGDRVLALESRTTKLEHYQSIKLNTQNGFGSGTSTRIPRFTNLEYDRGNAGLITYTDDAVNGAFFTINTKCKVTVTLFVNFSTSRPMGISLNANTTVDILSTMSPTLRMAYQDTPGANLSGLVCVTFDAFPNDIVRPHFDTGNTIGSAPARAGMQIYAEEII